MAHYIIKRTRFSSFFSTNIDSYVLEFKEKTEGLTEIQTQVVGFRVQSANHYTIRPIVRNH